MQSTDTLYKALIKAISYAAGLVVLLWFLYESIGVLLLFLFAIILALILNAPVSWLQKKGLTRVWACVVVFGIILVVLTGLGWLIIPKVTEQLTALIMNLPVYISHLSENSATWFSNYPLISKEIQEQTFTLSQWLPSLSSTLISIGNYSLSLIISILGFILFVSIIVYSVSDPAPLLELYFSVFPPAQRDKAQRALYNTSTMLIGWIRSNFIGGAGEGVLVGAFLTWMQVPGAWVWGVLAFFSELIPRLGFYIMSIPPILVALSVSGYTALWTTVFFLALNEIMGDFIMPKLRSSTMNIHPVSSIVILLALSASFGLIGALLSTPVTAIIKAYYEEFYLSKFKDPQIESRINQIIYRTEKG